jgi:WD40 repeat protein
MRGHADDVTALAFSPDGGRLVSGSDDNSVKVWDIDQGTLLRTLHGHIDNVTAVAFSPDGRRVVAGSKGALKVWAAGP